MSTPEELLAAAQESAKEPVSVHDDVEPEELEFHERVDLGGGDFAILRHPEELSAGDIRAAMRVLESGSYMGFGEALMPTVVKVLHCSTRHGKPIVPSRRNLGWIDSLPPKAYVKLAAVIAKEYVPFLTPDLDESDDPDSPTRG
jgi:hypothetical protein